MSFTTPTEVAAISADTLFYRDSFGTVFYSSAAAGGLRVPLRFLGVDDLFAVLKRECGYASMATVIADDTLAVEATAQMDTDVTFANAVAVDVDASGEIVYASSDEEVATVSATGLVTAVAAGTATITATYLGKYTASDSLTVS